MLSDTLSLIVFAVCVPTFVSGFSVPTLTIQILEIVVFVPVILLGLSRLGARALATVEHEEDDYFVLLLGLLAAAAVLASVVNLPGIVGSFLAGLAINAAVHDKPAAGKLHFFANSLFIPIFFMATGRIEPGLRPHWSTTSRWCWRSCPLFVGKWLAAELCGRAFGYASMARLTMWSLTLPQVAATLGPLWSPITPIPRVTVSGSDDAELGPRHDADHVSGRTGLDAALSHAHGVLRSKWFSRPGGPAVS